LRAILTRFGFGFGFGFVFIVIVIVVAIVIRSLFALLGRTILDAFALG
jgi:hypothetical protein